MIGVLVATLVLVPVLPSEVPMRAVATGVADATIHWRVDGRWAGTTRDREALEFSLGAGAHRVEAYTTWTGPWTVMVRAAPPVETMAYVEAFSASHEPQSQHPIPGPPLAVTALLLVALVARRCHAKTPSSLDAWPARAD